MVLVILKALDILELVSKEDGKALTLTEISSALKMSQPTAANIINTMVSRGYIEHVGKKKGYKLGPSSFRLTNEVAYEKDLVEAAKDEMDRLTSQINETCLLGVLRNQKRYTLHVTNSNQEIQVQVTSERNVYETASGRILLAFLSEMEKERFIQINGLPDQSVWPETSSKSLLHNSLNEIKTNEFVKTHLKQRQVIGFAVPIKSMGNTIAALSVFLPEYRCNIDKEMAILAALKNASHCIEKQLVKN